MTTYIQSNKALLLFLSILVFLSVGCSYKKKLTAQDVVLAPEFGSNMVFRKGDSITVFGTCSSYGILGVRLQDGLKTVESNKAGEWKVSFPPIDFNGEFEVVVEGQDQIIRLKNLVCGKLIAVAGDAWLGSDKVVHAEDQLSVNQRTNNMVRVFLPNYHLSSDKVQYSGEWLSLSSAAYEQRSSFASMLGNAVGKEYDGAVGVICLTYPATTINNFNKEKQLLSDSLYPSEVKDSVFEAYKQDVSTYYSLADTSNNGIRREVLNRYYDDWEWTETTMPVITGKRWYLKNRIAWMRKKIYIPEKFITSDFTIKLGAIRGQFDFYFNGKLLERFKGESANYEIEVPDSLINVWSNLLTVRMVCGDSLSGMYGAEPIIFNHDSSYKRAITEGWAVRTYYEPELPVIKTPDYWWPSVYESFFRYYKDKPIDELILAGGEEQYLNASDSELLDMIHTLETNFNADRNYIYLVSKESYVDSIINYDVFTRVRNQQLSVAATKGWKVINTLNVTRDRENIHLYYQKLLQCYIDQY